MKGAVETKQEQEGKDQFNGRRKGESETDIEGNVEDEAEYTQKLQDVDREGKGQEEGKETIQGQEGKDVLEEREKGESEKDLEGEAEDKGDEAS